jgi:hypothetical protein
VVGGVSTPEQSGWSCGSFSTRSLKHLHHSNSRVRESHSSPYCCWSLWWISADGTFSPTRNLVTMRCSTLRGTFCSLITLATPRQDWTGSNPSRREDRGCGSTLSRSHSCCAVRLVYTQISPGHIWTTLYIGPYVHSVDTNQSRSYLNHLVFPHLPGITGCVTWLQNVTMWPKFVVANSAHSLEEISSCG